MGDVVDKIFQLSKSREKEDFLHILFGDHVRSVTDGTIPIVLFGAGDVGKDLCEVLHLHGVYPKYFCDNSTSNIGNSYNDVPVISFNELKEKCRDHLILIASCKYATEIRQQLMDHAFPADKLISVAPIHHPELLRYYRHCQYYTKKPHHVLSEQDLRNHAEDLSRAYNLLADQKSRDIFIARLSLFTTKIDFLGFSKYVAEYSEINEEARGSYPFYVSPEDYGYFNNDVFALKQGEVLVDVGAYNGLSAATFAETCKRKNLMYKKIYCFEPDDGNFIMLQKLAEQVPDIMCINRGLWSESTTLTFLSNGECDPGAVLEACSETSKNRTSAHKIEIQTTSIDEQFPDEEITLIKMDIEGAEMEAIQGAANVIKRCRPKLAISAYHKRNDIYTLPLLINGVAPHYSFYLRQYGYTLFDMVLFAIPQA
ncbi:MAG TPA: FkbM family methyltransferase [Spirochaetia bacterium]|nr:FkbM family methyltransferase [Spirochaetia bacterium]